MNFRTAKNYTYEAVPGYFAHDHVERLPLPAVPPRFGLEDASEGRWKSLLDQIRSLNAENKERASYKLFILSRHGQGYHNVAESKYGTQAWDDYWSKLDGDGELIWGPDPELTSLGKDQARTTRDGWVEEAAAGLPPPHKRYCSPLTRALDTCDIMFDGVFKEHPYPVLIVENCREENGVHTCDKRSTRAHIAAYKPHFDIEDRLTQRDELWHPTIRETKPEVAERARKVIDMIYAKDIEDIFISITAHGGFINGFLTAVGRAPFTLPTGGVIPILVKATEEQLN